MMNSLKNTHILKLFSICLSLMVGQSYADFTEEELNPAQDCLIAGSCDGLVQCPYNRACFNNCDIGYDGGAKARKVGNMFATFFGFGHLKSAESNYQVVCRGDCITNLVTDCQKEQPLDITIAPMANDGDPGRLCREYCGAALREKDGNFQKCEDTCRRFDTDGGDGFTSLTQCYRQNKDNPLLGTDQVDPKTNKKVCDVTTVGSIMSPGGFEDNGTNVQYKLRGFAQEALCQIKPDARGCGSDLCATYGWLRSCEQEQQKLQAMMKKRKMEQDQGIIDYSVEALKTINQVNEALQRTKQGAADLQEQIKKDRAERAAEKAAGG